MSGIALTPQQYFGWHERQYQSDQLAALNNIPSVGNPNPVNAIQHAYTSATLQRDYPLLAETLGNANEVPATAQYSFWKSISDARVAVGLSPLQVQDNRADTFKDLWNNEVGRQIGEYVRQNNLTQGDLESLVIQAYQRGELIRDQTTDPAVPSNFSGWPSDFDASHKPTWGGPSPGWTPPGGPGQVGGLSPPPTYPFPPPSSSDPSNLTPPSSPPSSPYFPYHPSPLQQRDPIVLDLDGDGVELASVQDSNAHFDFSGSGFALHTGWITGGDGILVRDLDQNSTVSAAEVFGAISGNGYDDLEQLDSNADGKIDQNDTAFGGLRVWVDADGDAVGDAGELLTLAQAGVASINLTPQGTNDVVNGNRIVERGTFVRTDNSVGATAEVDFAVDTLNTTYTPPSGFTFSNTAFNLPTLIGYGNVPDLIYSMSLDTDLEDAVRDLVLSAGSTDFETFRAAFVTVIERWTGANGIDPNALGTGINARHLAIVERFYGITFSEMNGPNAPITAGIARNVEETYASIIDTLFVRFASQVSESQLLNGVELEDVLATPFVIFSTVNYNSYTDGITADFVSLVEDALALFPSEGSVTEQADYLNFANAALRALRVDLFAEDTDALISDLEEVVAESALGGGFSAMVVAVANGDDIVDTTSAGVSIGGSAGKEAFLVGTTDQTLAGGGGDDAYIYYRNVGGTITIGELAHGGSGDRLILRGVQPGDIAFTRAGASITIIITESSPGALDGGAIVLPEGLDDWYGLGIDFVIFEDGTVWTQADLRAAVLAHFSTSGNDTIVGFDALDTITGGAGDDALSGGAKDDTYIYARGDGHDTITETSFGGTDKLVLVGINPADLTFTRSGNAITIVIAASTPGGSDGGSITLVNGLDDYFGQGLDRVEFADGTVWTQADLRAAVLANFSTSGNDTIVGFDSLDTITGGAGDDALSGGAKDDTYIYARGDGHDTITETSFGGTDKLVLVGINPTDLTFTRSGNAITIVIAASTPGGSDGGSITLVNGLDDYFGQGLDRVEFADGTVWTQADLRAAVLEHFATSGNDTIVGFDAVDTITGGAGDDALSGGAKDDTYIYARGDGHDTITETSFGGIDKLVLVGINPADLTFTRSGNAITIVIAPSTPGGSDGGSITLVNGLDDYFGQGLDRVEFADGTVWTQADLRVAVLAHFATSGNDTIVGFDSLDTITGGAGDDALSGGAKDDTYVYARGDGHDTITETSFGGMDKLVLVGINPADLTFTRSGNAITIVIAPSTPGGSDGGSITLVNGLDDYFSQGLDRVEFADGTVWTQADLRAAVLEHFATSGNDTIVGFDSLDTITGGTGDDALSGGAKDDTYIYARGDGHDTITETSFGGTDKLVLVGINPTDLTFTRSGNAITIVIAASTPGGSDGGSITLVNGLDDYFGQGLDRVEFADGTVWTQADLRAAVLEHFATSGNDTIVGFDALDTITGGAGDDTLSGGAKDDTYIYARGDGHDTITETSFGGTDKLVLVGINPADVTVTRSGTNATIVIAPSTPGGSDGGSITLVNGLDSYFGQGVDRIQFADGTIWTPAELLSQSNPFAGTPGADTIDGTAAADTLHGQGGNDTLSGHGGDDALFGDDGDDVLNGNDGNDTLTGGSGNDTLRGGFGSDVYRYSSGNGNDVIAEGGSGSDADKLVLTNLNVADVTLVRPSSDTQDLVIRVTATGEEITVDNHFWATDYGIEQIEFAEGTIWNRSQIVANTIYAGTAAAETLNGTAGGDSFFGDAGNDTINGGAGSDIYIYRSGDGNDYLNDESGATSETDILRLTDLNPGDVTLFRNGVHAKLTVSATGDTITLDEQFYSTTAYYGFEQIQFADGTVWDRNQILTAPYYGTSGADTLYGGAEADALYGFDGNDTLHGNAGNDVLVGSLGDDVLIGGAGGDTYIYQSGDGNEYLNDDSGSTSETDILRLTNLNAGDVTLFRNGVHAKLTVNATGHTITLDEQFYSTTAYYGFEQIQFADGTVWDRNQIWTAPHYGSSGADTIYGGAGAETFYGFAGNDTVHGDAGSDVLVGGLGDDVLNGGAGGDTYIYQSGDGNEYLNDESGSTSEIDILRLTNLNPGDVTLIRNGNHGKLTVNATGHVITLDDQFYSTSAFYGFEQVQFADGTIWDRNQIWTAPYHGTSGADTLNGGADVDSLYGFDGNDTLNGNAGNDVLVGGLGNDALNGSTGSDTYLYQSGDGNDVLNDGSGSTSETDILQLTNLNPGDVTLVRTGNHGKLTVNATGHFITLYDQFYSTSANYGVEQIQFADGTVWDRNQMLTAPHHGTSGADTLNGGANADLMYRFAGNDTLNGNGGNDVLWGGLDNDSIRGHDGNDAISGDEGNDYVRGDAGSDVYTYRSGDGNDNIDDESGSTVDVDVLQLTDLNASDLTVSRSGDHAILAVNGTGQTITLSYQFYSTSANWGVEQVQFANGGTWGLQQIRDNAWIRGTSAGETINGFSGNDTILGGAGDDTLRGNGGNDVFVFKPGFGSDIIVDFTAGSGAGDVIEFNTSQFADFAAVLANAAQVGSDTMITFDASHKVTLQNVTLANLAAEDFRHV